MMSGRHPSPAGGKTALDGDAGAAVAALESGIAARRQDHVEIGTDHALSSCGGQRVAWPAVAYEELPAGLVLAGDGDRRRACRALAHEDLRREEEANDGKAAEDEKGSPIHRRESR